MLRLEINSGTDAVETPELRMSWTDPDAYQLFMGRWSELLTQPFLASAGVRSGGRVLDVACGTGVFQKRWLTRAPV